MMAEKQGITAEEFKAKWESEIPMKRLGEPHEFAALAAFWFRNVPVTSLVHRCKWTVVGFAPCSDFHRN